MVVSIDCEWNKLGTLLCLAFIEYRDDVEINRFIIKGNDSHLKTQLNIWKESNALLIGHNIKSDLLVIYENTGILLENVYDTMLAWQQLTNGKLINKKRVPANLGFVIEKCLGIVLDKSLQESFLNKFDYEFNDEERQYILNDVQYLLPLKYKLDTLIDKFGLHKSLDIDLKCLPVLVPIESKGMLVDTNKLKGINEQWEFKQANLMRSLMNILTDLGYPISTKIYNKKGIFVKEQFINFNSHIQVKAIFKHFGIPLPIDKNDKESTNMELLESFNLNNPDNILHTFIEVFSKYKAVSTLLSKYGSKFIANLRNGKTVHTEYTQCFTATGRLSSKGNKLKPYTTNLQNIPSNSDEGKAIMSCIIAREGYNVVTCDLSGCELRLAASLSQDPLLLANFNGGGDFHSELASVSWKCICEWKEQEFSNINKSHNPEWIGSDFRTVHKRVNFGLIYGSTAKRIAEVLRVPLNVATKSYKEIKRKIPKVFKYLETQQKLAKIQGYLISPYTGRIKYNLTTTEASNWQFQTANADIMKIALYRLHKHIKDNNIAAYIIGTIHDSAVLEVKIGEETEWIRIIMADALSEFLTGLKGEADISIAPYWKK